MSRIRQAAGWACVVLGASAAVLPAAAAPRPDSRAIVAIYPPWWDRARALDAGLTAGPALPGAAPFVVLVQHAGAAVSARLRRSGALLILDGELVTCLAEEARS